MTELLGYTCYSPASWWVNKIVLWWVVVYGCYLGYRVYTLKAELARLRAAPEPPAASRNRDHDAGRVYTLGENAPPNRPQPPMARPK